MRVRPVGPTYRSVGFVARAFLAILPLIAFLTTTPAWSDESTSPQITPGVGIGPARLGMPEAQAQRALAAAGLTEPGCVVDVLTDHGRVVTLGTRFGGCIALPLPRLARLGRLTYAGGMIAPEFGGIGGSPGPLFREFGEPRRFVVDRAIVILLWPNGLVARIATSEDDEVVTYLAVVPAGTTVPPYSLLSPPPHGAGAVQPHKIFVNGMWLAYEDVGKGPPIVLVPGSFSDYRIWFNQIEAISQHHRVIAYSRRYNWPNAAPGQGADGSIMRQVDDLAALIKGLGIAPAHIVGHSYGGSIALVLALTHPELVRTLVLAEPGVRTVLENVPGGEADLKVFQDFSATMQQAFAAGDPKRIVKTLVDFVAPGELASLPTAMHEMFGANIPAVKVEGNSRFSCEDARRIVVPTLVLTGEQSPNGYRHIANVVAHCVAQGNLVTIPRASHPMQLLNPQAFNQAVLTFAAKY